MLKFLILFLLNNFFYLHVLYFIFFPLQNVRRLAYAGEASDTSISVSYLCLAPFELPFAANTVPHQWWALVMLEELVSGQGCYCYYKFYKSFVYSLVQIHLVHYNEKYSNVSDAASHVNDTSALAVVGVFVDVRKSMTR